jgi:hypothetical protein
MGCFDNLIGYRGGCTETTATSGLYLDQLGINLKQLDDIVQDDYDSGEDLLSDKISFSIKKMASSINQRFAEKFVSKTIVEGDKIGQYYDNQTLVTGEAGYLKGIRIEVCNDKAFFDFYISEIALQVNTTGNVSVVVYDLIQNKLLDTITVAAVAGNISTYWANKTYTSYRKKMHLFIGYDSSAINSYQSTVALNACTDCAGGIQTHSCNRYVKVVGAKIASASSKILSNTVNMSETGGVTLNYSLQCNHQEWLCTYSNILALPLLYLTAAEVFKYGTISQRENATTIIDLKKWEEMYEYCMVNYAQEMDNIVKRIDVPCDNICFRCNEKSRVAIILP